MNMHQAASPRTETESSFKILVVDDEEGIRELTRIILEEDGFEVTVASNGQDALVALANDRFVAVVLDYQMPGANGDEVLREIRHKNDGIPVVMHSSYAVGIVQDRCPEASAVVAKSSDGQKLVQTVKQLLVA